MARYEYNSPIDEIEVSYGQAFEYEDRIARKPLGSNRAMHQVNEAFRIQEVNGIFKVQYLQNGTWHYHQVVIALNGTPQSWWCYSYDEAYALVQAYMAVFEWLNGFAIATQEWEMDKHNAKRIRTRLDWTEEALLELHTRLYPFVASLEAGEPVKPDEWESITRNLADAQSHIRNTKRLLA